VYKEDCFFKVERLIVKLCFKNFLVAHTPRRVIAGYDSYNLNPPTNHLKAGIHIQIQKERQADKSIRFNKDKKSNSIFFKFQTWRTEYVDSCA
jgi:hypothetical protein